MNKNTKRLENKNLNKTVWNYSNFLRMNNQIIEGTKTKMHRLTRSSVNKI